METDPGTFEIISIIISNKKNTQWFIGQLQLAGSNCEQFLTL